MKIPAMPNASRLHVLLGVTVFIIAFAVAYWQAVPVPSVSLEWQHGEIGDSLYTPDYRQESGSELALVYIGSSTCTASNEDFLLSAIEELKLLMKERAKERDRSFTAIGVSVDWNVEDGVAHLRKFGRFDEIMTGRKWSNVGALKYIWEDIPGKGGTPQVLVIDRHFRVPSRQNEVPGYSISREELLMRKVGTKEIQQWLERDAPVPNYMRVNEAPK
jgi:hypothetical protein